MCVFHFNKFSFGNCFHMIRLVEEILHQFIGSLSHYLQGFIHVRWLFGISSINSMFVSVRHWAPCFVWKGTSFVELRWEPSWLVGSELWSDHETMMIIYLCTLIISYFQNKIHIYIYMIICIFVYLQCLFTYLYVSCIIYKNKNHHYFRIFSLTTLEPPSLHANAGDVGDGISVGTGISCSRRSTVVHGVAPLGPVEAPKND